MKTFYAPDHAVHAPAFEFEAGRLAPIPECPARAESVRTRIAARKLGPILAPATFGMQPILRVHDERFVLFLAHAHDDWIARYGAAAADAIPSAWPARGLRANHMGNIEARLGSYAFDTATPITHGTWTAARAAVDVALSGARCLLDGENAVFALTRPPGHHAGPDLFGRYCYLNNAAIAAQWWADQGRRSAILDVDYHHGNGTQAIFYRRSDVFYCSIHADPAFAYPHFAGFADERGEGAGEGCNLNLPLRSGTEWGAYLPALERTCAAINDFGAHILLVSLGLDTFEHDPISDFRLTSEDYLRLGERIAQIGKPTLFVLEGGYHLETLGNNAANVLEGFLQSE
jgi:acetoin utilization deacetylase AcuC-like enzyme